MDSEIIKKWLSGSGYGDGDGDGDGSGYGYGYGDGDGYGYGDGYGDGDGDGDGSGYGYKLKIHSNNEVFYIDNIPTVILSIIGNTARGYTINKDFSTVKCFIAKSNGYFAHGNTLRDAVNSLSQKITQNMSEEDRISEFCKTFEKDKSYSGSTFFDWHNRLTGSCLLGRKQFIENNGLSLDAEYTVQEFIKLTEQAYGGDIIKKLKPHFFNSKEK